MEFGGAKHEISIRIDNNLFKTTFPGVQDNDIVTSPIHEDEIAGFRYTFLNLPIEYLHHDDHINPRAIGSNLKKLIEEFHKGLPQLHVSLGLVDTRNGRSTKLKIFDGQHKAAAQILLGVRRLPVRVFIDPDTDRLLTANTHAGTTLRQVAFDKSVQRSLGSSLLADRMDRYRHDCGRDEDDESFSERDLVNHFKSESREMKRYVIDRVRDSVTTHPDNKLRDYIDYGGRGTERPISYSTVEKTFYSFFIHGDLLTTAFNYRQEEGTNPRQLEIDQIVQLMNVIAEKIYIGQFEHSRGTRRIEHNIQKGKDVPEPHLRAFRMAREEILYNWLRYVKQIIQNYFVTTGKPIDERKMFQYPIPDACWENIDNFLDALKRLSLWMNRDLSITVFGGKQNNDYWQEIFESGRAPNGVQVMASGINLMDMIKAPT
ncbi:MAG: HNH endonuclease [Acidobacteria bacterium]|nr:HNH endonuclease [Acidobacteriota bacterium]